MRWRTRLMTGPVLYSDSGRQQKCSQSFSSMTIPGTTSAQLLPPVETSGDLAHDKDDPARCQVRSHLGSPGRGLRGDPGRHGPAAYGEIATSGRSSLIRPL